MSVIDLCETSWAKLTPTERYEFLAAVSSISPMFDSEGMGIRALSCQGDFNKLPQDVCGRLILALTEKGFDIDEYLRCRDAYVRCRDAYVGRQK